ncbi:MAG: hypothetical protein JNK87_06350 [Bryobacterales bacterium]|nr:hypothetical protein [Bryobacterales bacterium]
MRALGRDREMELAVAFDPLRNENVTALAWNGHGCNGDPIRVSSNSRPA